MRLTSTFRGTEHHVTIPDHEDLRVGTLRAILGSVASYVKKPVEALIEDLFG